MIPFCPSFLSRTNYKSESSLACWKILHDEKQVVVSGICLLIFGPFFFSLKSEKLFFNENLQILHPVGMSAHSFLKSVEVWRFGSSFFFLI